MNGSPIPQTAVVKYFGMHLDQRLTWAPHIINKSKQLGLRLRSMYGLQTKSSKVPLKNKILIYKAILKPIWIYGIQIWGSVADSNIAIFEGFQTKTLRLFANVPWYITNRQIYKEPQPHCAGRNKTI